ncbi:MAG: hypothetical protein ACI4XQ_08760 [Eubacteriales bacterium]
MVKKIFPVILALVFSLAQSACSPSAADLDTPEEIRNYEAISAAFSEKNWDALNGTVSWESMRRTGAVRSLAAGALSGFYGDDDWQNACALLTHMSFDYVDGGEYYASSDFMAWLVSHFSVSGERFIKTEGSGGYYDSHQNELSEFTNYDENTGVEYISKVWYLGDFALNIYTVRNRETQELLYDNTVGLYVRGVCIHNTTDSTKNINGESLLRGYLTNGTYYSLGGYILCNVGTSCLDSFSLIPSDGSGYAVVRVKSEDYSGKQYRIG